MGRRTDSAGALLDPCHHAAVAALGERILVHVKNLGRTWGAPLGWWQLLLLRLTVGASVNDGHLVHTVYVYCVFLCEGGWVCWGDMVDDPLPVKP